ncbi:MAG: EamA family transporter [Myxococcales bacterium]|nr:EamA family transporter [Myxococcales bacterium]
MSGAAVLGLVIFAGLLHASWNALLKASGDRLLTFAVVLATGAVCYAPVAWVTGAPGHAAWPYLAGSGVVHVFYFAFLLFAYEYGDLSLVYPIARGVGPLIVAGVSALVIGEPVRGVAAAGVVLVSLGVIGIGGAGARAAPKRALGFAALTGVFIAAYTLCDGLGVRAGGSKLAYVAWLHLIIGAPFSSVVFWRRRAVLGAFLSRHGARAIGGGLCSALAYSLVIYAMSVGRIASVASAREVSVVFAALIGARLLGEGLGGRRLIFASAVALGIVCLALGR